ncbi:MAG: isoprenylcysteine carboxylmethyltransferase family protein, partial [Pirellulales bacterium]
MILVPFAVVAFMTPPYAAEGSSLDFLADAMAWLIFVMGGTFRWWATLYIGNRKQCVLVTDGPYSLCRNPLYVGTFLIVLSIA